MNTGEQVVTSNNGLLTTLAFQIGRHSPPHYALEGAVAYCGSTIQWLRDNLQIIPDVASSEKYALEAADNGGVYFVSLYFLLYVKLMYNFSASASSSYHITLSTLYDQVPAFSGLFAPYWDDSARGVIVGLTAYNTRAHICRAALEACAFQVDEIVTAMITDAGLAAKSLKVDGGLTQNSTAMQFQSSILNVPLSRPMVAETTVLGAAFAAGLAVGFWRDTDELRRIWKSANEWNPNMELSERQTLRGEWKEAIKRSIGLRKIRLTTHNDKKPINNETERNPRSKFVVITALIIMFTISVLKH